MKIINLEKREQVIFWLALMVSIVSVVSIAVLLAGEVYVRWYINKDFTFLGGLELEALILAAFGLVGAMMYRYR